MILKFFNLHTYDAIIVSGCAGLICAVLMIAYLIIQDWLGFDEKKLFQEYRLLIRPLKLLAVIAPAIFSIEILYYLGVATLFGALVAYMFSFSCCLAILGCART